MDIKHFLVFEGPTRHLLSEGDIVVREKERMLLPERRGYRCKGDYTCYMPHPFNKNLQNPTKIYKMIAII